MLKQTPLYELHVESGGKMVDFSGWSMPIHYGSQVQEHHKVRQAIGMFDVSHMTVVDVEGKDARRFLQTLLANDVGRLKSEGKALYSCMLTEKGGVIDDLIVYFMNKDWYRMVVNAATRDRDIEWINQQAQSYSVTITERPELAMIAVQGPKAEDYLAKIFAGETAKAIRELKPFNAVICKDIFIARTGYTGEDGFEIILQANAVVQIWKKLLASDVPSIGLGARDTLRLEAGMNLYGVDMDDSVTPLESGLGWTVAWEPETRDFIGRQALEQQRANKPKAKLVGLLLEDKGILRDHQKVTIAGVGSGEITSGSYSPTLGKSIAFARIPSEAKIDCTVEIRGKILPVKIVKAPFVRNGKSCI